ncbi:MAG: DUF2344 domain-containing protein [Lachnospiraceae bacterium]|nr:DUF2344 domain-containing protein [Lachnospiraceae bacterium]
MNIRIRFGKEGMMRYIGHLDVLRTFQKIFRRAGVPMIYSNGYSPHPVMSFALPLGLGQTSEGEYLDAAVEDGADPKAVLRALKEATSQELPVYALRVLPEKAENAMAAVGGAVWKVILPENMPAEGANSALKAILNRETIILPKKTKTREIELDIRPMIVSAAIENGSLLMTIAAGSRANLAPDVLPGLLAAQMGLEPDAVSWQIRRLDLLDHNGLSLGSVGEEP